MSVDGKTRVDDDVWHHVAYVFVMEPIGINAFYVDGKLDAEAIISGEVQAPEAKDVAGLTDGHA